MNPQSKQCVVVIGASAGGVEALTRLVQLLPARFNAPVLVVLHLPSTNTSVLPQILSRVGPLKAEHPRDGEMLEAGKIYIAPPNYHLGIQPPDAVLLSKGPRENNVRPAVDFLFRSAARAYGSQTIGVILSGLLHDGTSGLKMIKDRGGTAIVQDPSEAVFDSMPVSAIENVPVDYVLPIQKIAEVLVQLTENRKPREGDFQVSQEDEFEKSKNIIQTDIDSFREGKDLQNRTVLTCPECGGMLWEVREGKLVLYECFTGHRYLADNLLDTQGGELEAALWTAVRMMEERANLLTRLVNQSIEMGNPVAAQRFKVQSDQMSHNAEIFKKVIENLDLFTGRGEQDGGPS